MNVVVFVLNDVGPMLEVCLNDVGMLMVHILSKSCQNALQMGTEIQI
jgi:hypothetical protein